MEDIAAPLCCMMQKVLEFVKENNAAECNFPGFAKLFQLGSILIDVVDERLVAVDGFDHKLKIGSALRPRSTYAATCFSARQ